MRALSVVVSALLTSVAGVEESLPVPSLSFCSSLGDLRLESKLESGGLTRRTVEVELQTQALC